MTSSLVGSEMCIRDRCKILREKEDRSAHSLFVEALSRVGHNLDDAIPKPVSYTHLTLPTICSV
eukprot:6277817-Prorocentrum_lima.AAC.1